MHADFVPVLRDRTRNVILRTSLAARHLDSGAAAVHSRCAFRARLLLPEHGGRIVDVRTVRNTSSPPRACLHATGCMETLPAPSSQSLPTRKRADNQKEKGRENKGRTDEVRTRVRLAYPIHAAVCAFRIRSDGHARSQWAFPSPGNSVRLFLSFASC